MKCCCGQRFCTIKTCYKYKKKNKENRPWLNCALESFSQSIVYTFFFKQSFHNTFNADATHFTFNIPTHIILFKHRTMKILIKIYLKKSFWRDFFIIIIILHKKIILKLWFELKCSSKQYVDCIKNECRSFWQKHPIDL